MNLDTNVSLLAGFASFKRVRQHILVVYGLERTWNRWLVQELHCCYYANHFLEMVFLLVSEPGCWSDQQIWYLKQRFVFEGPIWKERVREDCHTVCWETDRNEICFLSIYQQWIISTEWSGPFGHLAICNYLKISKPFCWDGVNRNMKIFQGNICHIDR